MNRNRKRNKRKNTQLEESGKKLIARLLIVYFVFMSSAIAVAYYVKNILL